MSNHSDALTPEEHDFIERGRQFQVWADQNGFGMPKPQKIVTYEWLDELIDELVPKVPYLDNQPNPKEFSYKHGMQVLRDLIMLKINKE